MTRSLHIFRSVWFDVALWLGGGLVGWFHAWWFFLALAAYVFVLYRLRMAEIEQRWNR